MYVCHAKITYEDNFYCFKRAKIFLTRTHRLIVVMAIKKFFVGFLQRVKCPSYFFNLKQKDYAKIQKNEC